MRLTHDQYYLRMLGNVADRSTCVRRKVGAIFVDGRGRAVSMGYNGVPSGFGHCTDEPCAGAKDPPGDTRRCMAVHAEVNAALNCTVSLDEVEAVYCSCSPCFVCAKMLANFRSLKRVVVLGAYAESDGELVLIKAKIEVVCVRHVDGVAL